MESPPSDWSDQEQAVAKAAFEVAYGRAIDGLISSVRQQMQDVETDLSLWQLHDFLSIQRHVIEGRFDFRFEGILFVFASLVKEGLLSSEELQGLDNDKLGKIKAMSCF
ncbi:MAG: hypothetical protein R6W06_13385 [Prochlorococcaceae cyanobacterium]